MLHEGASYADWLLVAVFWLLNCDPSSLVCDSGARYSFGELTCSNNFMMVTAIKNASNKLRANKKSSKVR